MKLRNRVLLNVSQCEERCTPSASVVFSGGNLTVRGDNTSNNLAFFSPAPGQITVNNNGTVLGNYAVTGNLSVIMGNSSDTVGVSLLGNSLGGNLSINMGTNSAGVADTVLLGNGTVNGTLTVNGGLGDDQIFLNAFNVSGILTNINGGTGSDKLTVDAASTLGGTALFTNLNDVSFSGSASAVVQGAGSEGVNTTSNYAPGSNISGDLTFTGGQGVDSLTLSGCINGNATVVTNGGASSSFQLAGGTINGSLNYVGGAGDDAVQMIFTSTIAGNASFNMGNGTNNYTLSDNTSSVFGGFTLTAGSGTDNVGALGLFMGGNVNLNLGNGANTVNFTGSFNSANITYQGGSSADNVTVTGSYASALRFFGGAGADSFTYLAGSSVGSAYLDFGVDNAVDTYVQGMPVITWSQTIVNLP